MNTIKGIIYVFFGAAGRFRIQFQVLPTVAVSEVFIFVLFSFKQESIIVNQFVSSSTRIIPSNILVLQSESFLSYIYIYIIALKNFDEKAGKKTFVCSRN